MKTLTWRPILFNLSEAYEELADLHDRLYFLTFGEVPDDCTCKAWIKGRDKRHPFTEMSLHVSLDHAYHHLNFAWNIRRTPEEREHRLTNKYFKRWSRFPRTRDFADLWPSQQTILKEGGREPECGKVSFTPVRTGVQTARRKLAILCYLVAKEIGEDSRWSTRPDSLDASVNAQPLTEREFARRMHRIYAELNFAWNSRKDKTFVTERNAIRRRQCFSPMFMPGVLVSK